MNGRILVVGAGFAGTTYARELADNGYDIEVIDKRRHIAGNAFDRLEPNGTRVHQYGPHLLHTNNQRVIQWLQRFTEFVNYEHKVQAELADGRMVPLPVNRHTINEVFGVQLRTAEAVEAFLRTQAVSCPNPRNAAEYLTSQIGITLTDLFFRPYTRKMWALDLEDLHASVVKRIPLRFDEEDRYFPNDIWQVLPRDGYTDLIGKALDHPRIKVILQQPFEQGMRSSYRHCFNSMPIDEYFGFSLGPLPYRSIRFHRQNVPNDYARGQASVINFTDDGMFTRETDWSRLPHHGPRLGPTKTITREEPCDYVDNNLERYYPVKTSDGRYDAVYQNYKELARKEQAMTFVGRCGTYQYLDMHQVINQSLIGASAWMGVQQ